MEKRDLDIITNCAVNWRMYLNCAVLITGATGRLGRYIMETLADVDLKYNLNMRILGLARSEEKAREVFDNLLGTMKRSTISFTQRDLQLRKITTRL